MLHATEHARYVYGGVATSESGFKSIEHMLGTLLDDKKLRNLRELESRLIDEWKQISVIEEQKVIASMPDCIDTVPYLLYFKRQKILITSARLLRLNETKYSTTDHWGWLLIN